jgi:hypothetical protein
MNTGIKLPYGLLPVGLMLPALVASCGRTPEKRPNFLVFLVESLNLNG